MSELNLDSNTMPCKTLCLRNWPLSWICFDVQKFNKIFTIKKYTIRNWVKIQNSDINNQEALLMMFVATKMELEHITVCKCVLFYWNIQCMFDILCIIIYMLCIDRQVEFKYVIDWMRPIISIAGFDSLVSFWSLFLLLNDFTCATVDYCLDSLI